jgi:hypothetical protein
MFQLRFVAVLVAGFVLAGVLTAADPPPLTTAQGQVEKVEKDSLTIQPRAASGKFAKSVVLKLTGTSEFTLVSAQTRAGKVVIVQRKNDAKDLLPKQGIAVIYTTDKGGSVLLSAVAQPAPES